MKQKILYILMIITALIGGNAEAWAQSGYVKQDKDFTYEADVDAMKNKISNDRLSLEQESQISTGVTTKTYFTIGDNVDGNVDLSGIAIFTTKNRTENTIKWSTAGPYTIVLNKFETSMATSFSTGSKRCVTFYKSSNLDKGYDLIPGGIGNPTSFALDITSSDIYIKMSATPGSYVFGSPTYYYYFKSVKFNYTLSYYELDLAVLEKAIKEANDALSTTITDETMKEHLNAAIATANDMTFRNECAFPNSFWYKNNNNEVSEGKWKPSDVEAKADKLIAVTQYLLARTAANVYAEEDVPDAVYQKLHPYDDRNPNDYTTDEVNGATAEINIAIELAETTTEVYKKAKADIATAAARTDHNDATTLAKDVKRANDALEAATTIVAIENAKKEIKDFDEIRFNSQNEIQEGRTLPNPASANSGEAITYKSSNDKIIEIDGTTLRALKPGTVTITATTTTGDKYYGYTTTKEFTVTPKAVILYPGEKCTIVPNIVYPEIKLERSFSAKTHYTLTLPFDSNISDIGGDYAAQLALVTYNKADGYTLYFQKVTNGQMLANQPYVIYLPNEAEKPTWTDVTVVAPNAASIEVNGWTMQGNYTPKQPMEGNYGIAGGKFRLGTKGSTINAYTAYFTFLGTKNVRARVAVMDEGGNTTYIGELKDGVLQTEEGIYGLDGVQQNQLRKGINIVRMKDGKVRKILK